MTVKINQTNLGAPKCTERPITDITKWLKAGSIVRLYNSAQKQDGFVFDTQCNRNEKERIRVIWVDFAEEPNLLKNDWVPNILKKDKYTLCTCEIGKKVAAGQSVSKYCYRRDIAQGPARLV